MIVDSSALLAVWNNEPEAVDFSAVIDAALVCRISAATLLEAMIVADRNSDPIGGRKLDDLLERIGVVVEPVTEEQVRVGRAAYRDFGKGSRHPAQLNYGDCFAYALAKTSGEPLLFKGNDFIHTDIRPAV